MREVDCRVTGRILLREEGAWGDAQRLLEKARDALDRCGNQHRHCRPPRQSHSITKKEIGEKTWSCPEIKRKILEGWTVH